MSGVELSPSKVKSASSAAAPSLDSETEASPARKKQRSNGKKAIIREDEEEDEGVNDASTSHLSSGMDVDGPMTSTADDVEMKESGSGPVDAAEQSEDGEVSSNRLKRLVKGSASADAIADLMADDADADADVDMAHGGKVLRAKRDLSSADKKKIAQATADRKNQPSVASFFGGKPAAKGITAFFKPTTSSKSSDPTTNCTMVDEHGETAAASTSSPTKVSPKPTAAKRKREAEEKEKDKDAESDAAKVESEKEQELKAKKELEAKIKAEAAAKAEAVAKERAEKAAAQKRKEEEAEKQKQQERKEKEQKEKAEQKEQEKEKEKEEEKSQHKAKAKESEHKSKAKLSPKPKKGKAVADDDAAAESADASAESSKPKSTTDEADADDWSDADEEMVAAVNEESADDVTDPVKAATWKQGEDVPYAALAAVFQKLEETTGSGSRLANLRVLSDFFRSVIAVTPKQLVTCVYLCCNEIAPAYQGRETQVGDAILIRALAQSTGSADAHIKDKIKSEGDLGEVAMTLRASQKTLQGMFGAAKPKPKLMCKKVFDTFFALSDKEGLQGAGSQQKRSDLIKKLLVDCQGQEAKYILRALQGNLRINMAEKGVISALARAVTLTPPSLNGKLPPSVLDIRRVTKPQTAVADLIQTNLQLINQAYIELPNHDKVIECILTHGVTELPNKVFLEPGIPVKVMLGKPTSGVSFILDKFQSLLFTLEYKYDGARAQIHLLDDGTIKIYSRNSEDDTSRYPDVIAHLPNAFNKQVKLYTPPTDGDSDKKEEDTVTTTVTESGETSDAASSSSSSTPLIRNFIIDCEMVAWDKITHKILPFQALSTRKKKDVKIEDVTVNTCLFGFDLLFLNGQSYINEPLIKRREVLRSYFHPVQDEFAFATSKDTSDPEEITNFMNEAVKNSCEGLMIKGLEVDATYVPNKRNWFKLKKDYMDGVADSLDLVVIGGWYGRGKRTGAYGAFLLATYDEETEEYQSICKVGTGLSDETLETSTKFFNEHILDKAPRYYRYPENDVPDVWFDTKQVWEIRCADLSISPAHKAAIGKVDPEKGIALRFPRLIRVRDDKRIPEQLTTADQVVHLFESQSVQGGEGGATSGRRPGGR